MVRNCCQLQEDTESHIDTQQMTNTNLCFFSEDNKYKQQVLGNKLSARY